MNRSVRQDVGILNGGPQDGARVKRGGGKQLPACVFVHAYPNDDGFSAWGTDFSERFPCMYGISKEQPGGDLRYHYVGQKQIGTKGAK